MKSNELFEQIHSGFVEENSTIKVMTEEGDYITEIKYKNGRLEWKPETFSTKYLCDINIEFEVEKPEIDIQNIDDYSDFFIDSMLPTSLRPLGYQIRELIRAVKKLDNQINNK